MSALRHFGDQLGAVWDMAFNREGWEQRLDVSVDGVLSSFWAMLPMYALAIYVSWYVYGHPEILEEASRNLGATETTRLPPLPLWLGTQTISFFAEWIASLAILVFAGQRLAGRQRAATLIASYNWMQVPFRTAMIAPMLVLFVTGSQELSAILFLPAIIFCVLFLWGVLRRALPGVDWSVIIGIMLALTIALFVIAQIVGALARIFS